MDALVREVLLEVCGPQETHNAFDWLAGGRNPIWVQTTLTLMLRIFERVILQTNLGKTKATVCTPFLIWGQQVESAHKRQVRRKGDTFWDRKGTRVN